MPVASKSRFSIPLLLLLMLTPLMEGRPADASFRKVSMVPPPKSVVIPGREPRPLSRREIFRAIQEDLARRGISGQDELRPEDLNIQSSVPVLNEDMGLKVKRIGFDPIRRETVFELWTSHEPQYLPFEVTTRRDPQGLGLTTLPGWNHKNADGESRNPAITQRDNSVRSKLPVLAKPGKPATLVMLGQNVRITTTVDPLQPGTKGQSILVRDLVTARVMRAEVVDDGLLRTSF
jgi:hypothetical protein